MRTVTQQGYSGNAYRITYPADNIWLGDNNTIIVENLSETRFGCRVTLYDGTSTYTRTLAYRSDRSIVFDLNSTLLVLWGGLSFDIVDVNVELFDSDYITPDITFSFTTNLLDGKSFTSQSHACERTVYVYSDEDVEFFEIYFEAAGEVTIGSFTTEVVKGFNTLDLSGVVMSQGEYNLHYRAAGITPEVRISSFEPDSYYAMLNMDVTDTSGSVPSYEKRGGIWVDSEFVPAEYDIAVIRQTVCEDFFNVRIDYKNADGCNRHIVGKLMDETTSVTQQYYNRMDYTVFENIPYRNITGMSQTVKVVFDDIARDSYWQSCLLSREVWYKNYNYERYQCVINTSKITRSSEKHQDGEIEITLIRQ